MAVSRSRESRCALAEGKRGSKCLFFRPLSSGSRPQKVTGEGWALRRILDPRNKPCILIELAWWAARPGVALQMLLGVQERYILALLDLDQSKGNNMKNVFMRLWKEEEGQDLTEYALLLVLLS